MRTKEKAFKRYTMSQMVRTGQTMMGGWMTQQILAAGRISCDADGFVTDIDLKNNNLAGHFPVYTRNANAEGNPILVSEWQRTKYGMANLYKLQMLDLADNKLTGTIENHPIYNLRVLTRFDVSGNQLRGKAEAIVATSLKYANFSNNGFTSMRHFERYKVSPLQSLRVCDVSNNTIQEDAADLLENIPPNIEQFI